MAKMKVSNISWSVFALIASGTAANAQGVDPPESSENSESSESSESSEITVTAQRREQSLMDVPLAMSALSGEQLASKGVVDTADLAKVSPGVLITQIGASPTVTAINIRGVAQLDYADHQESPNALYLDGTYVSFQGAAGIGMYDVDRVEVLRGPQGTLFGRNATGGLVQIISRKPEFNNSGFIETSYGSYNHARVEGALNFSPSDTLAVRGSLLFNRQDGYIRNSAGRDGAADKTINGRLQARWEPSTGIENTLAVFVSETPGTSGGTYTPAASAPDPANHLLTNLTDGPLFSSNCAELGYPPVSAPAVNCLGYVRPSADPYRVEAAQIGRFERHVFGVTNTLEADFSDAVQLASITNYMKLKKTYQEDSDGTPLDVITYHARQSSWQFSQEIRLSGESDRFRWQVGAYHLRIDGDHGVAVDLTDSFGITVGGNYAQKVRTYSIFGQGEYDIAPTVTLIGGLRQTWDEKRFNMTALCTLNPADCTSVGFAPTGYRFQGRHKNSDWSGKAQIVWKPTSDLNLYAGVSRGNKGSLIVAPVPVGVGAVFSDILVKPEVLTDYEAGAKASLWDGKLSLNASAFYYDYKNYQAYSFVGISQQIFNAKAHYYGGEVGISLRTGGGLSMNLNGAFLHTQVLDVMLPDGTVRDQKAPYAPAVSLNGDVRQEFDLGDQGGTVFMQGSVAYFSSRYFSTINEPAIRAGAAATVDASIGYISPSRDWDVSLMVTNLTDEIYTSYAVSVSSIAGFTQLNYNRPRWIRITAAYHF